MTHRQPDRRQRPPRFPRITVRHLKVTSGVLSVVLAGLAGGVAYTSSTDTEPSPTLAIAAPGSPHLFRDYGSGGLASVEPTPSPEPVAPRTVAQPTVVYEPAPTTVVVPPLPPRVIYLPAPPLPAVVREVPVAVQVEQPRREHRPGKKRERSRDGETTTLAPDEDETGQVCAGQWICVDREERERPEDSDDKRDRSKSDRDKTVDTS